MNAKWASRVFGWVVRRMGVSLNEVAGDSNPAGVNDTIVVNGQRGSGTANGQRQSEEDGRQEQQQEGQEQLQQQMDSGFYQNPPLDLFEGWPDSWTQDLIEQGVLEDQDQMIFDLFGAPFQ